MTVEEWMRVLRISVTPITRVTGEWEFDFGPINPHVSSQHLHIPGRHVEETAPEALWGAMREHVHWQKPGAAHMRVNDFLPDILPGHGWVDVWHALRDMDDRCAALMTWAGPYLETLKECTGPRAGVAE